MAFDSLFEALTGNLPFPWQKVLFSEFSKGRIPKSCNIPTGLGKTSTIAIWLLALAHRSRAGSGGGFPRRLVYIVNRRTVVDQATREVEQVRQALAARPVLQEVVASLQSLIAGSSDQPLAISTLRGQFADNAEWRNDPARAAVIVGTVDMIGSRLLFGGYGCGFKSRPLHAGFLGQDALLVHDEAHLEPAFQALLSAIESEQQRCQDFRRLQVMEMTATSRGSSQQFEITDADLRHSVAKTRLTAKKGLNFLPIEDELKLTAEEVTRCALAHDDSGQAILVFLRSLDHVKKVAERIAKAGHAFQTLTGTMRGLERDRLAREDDIYARFMPTPKVGQVPPVVPRGGTVYLVCTSAGEVGVDLSADHMVCDLTPFDSMAQRFGRVNRFGNGDARIDIIYPAAMGKSGSVNAAAVASLGAPRAANIDKVGGESMSLFDQARARTLLLLQRLPKRRDQRYEASPIALRGLPTEARLAAFTPPPAILPVSDMLFDAWALTSLRQKIPGRPPLTDWLHGLAEWDPPETQVAWRNEVAIITGELLALHPPEDLLEDYPLKPHELLRERTDRALKELKELASHHGACNVWLIAADESVSSMTLDDLVRQGENALRGGTVLLPPDVGGLETGMLRGEAPPGLTAYDVADALRDPNGRPQRLRVWDNQEHEPDMRLVKTIDTRPDADDAEREEVPRPRYWHWYVRPRLADDDGSRTAIERQILDPHLLAAEDHARRIVSKVLLGEPEASAVTAAAKWHDLGKNRRVWQRSIGNGDYPKQVLAKSGGTMRLLELNSYRHEFGSVLDVRGLPEFKSLSPERQDLILHLIAAHHGRARPHFPVEESFDPERPESEAAALLPEVPQRFARLQRKYGRWGLAYLESLVRAADALASQPSDGNQSKLGLPGAKLTPGSEQ